MTELRYTLLSDGSSDRALIPILTWLLRRYLPCCAIQSAWADLRRLPSPPKGLAARIDSSIDLYPCDLLFIHRDAESASRDQRVQEIEQAKGNGCWAKRPSVCVIPVRMTEAWLLFDEAAIRRASGNPNGKVQLCLPPDVESIPDPKRCLRELLLEASGLSDGRQKRFQVERAALRVSEHAGNFSALRNLQAFAALENDLAQTLGDTPWLLTSPAGAGS